MRDFVHVASPLGVTHFMIISNTKVAPYLRIARSPHGPTLTFKIHSYSLAADIANAQPRPRAPASIYKTPPLVSSCSKTGGPSSTPFFLAYCLEYKAEIHSLGDDAEKSELCQCFIFWVPSKVKQLCFGFWVVGAFSVGDEWIEYWRGAFEACHNHAAEHVSGNQCAHGKKLQYNLELPLLSSLHSSCTTSYCFFCRQCDGFVKSHYGCF